MKAIIVGGQEFSSHDRVYDLVAEDGEHLASHICSHPCFAPGDLYEHRPERKEMFDAKGITECVWLEDSGVALDELLRRNKEWAASQPVAVQEGENE